MTSLEEMIGSHRWRTVHPSLWEPEMHLRPFLGLILDRSTGAISVENFAIDLEADEWVLLLLRSDDTWDGRKAWADDLLAWSIPSGGARNPIEFPIEYIGGPCDPNAPSSKETQEALALLKILALSNQDMATGKATPAADIVNRLGSKQATD
jgi:hypothetical protein